MSDERGSGRIIGKMIGSRDHSNYIVKLNDADDDPTNVNEEDEHASLGQFVRIGGDMGNACIVGIITSCRIVTEDSLDLGYFQRGELDTFTPELMDGSFRLLTVKGVGFRNENGEWVSEVPRITPGSQDPIFHLRDEEIIDFHLQEGKLRMGYLLEFNAKNNHEERAALLSALGKLAELIPTKHAVIGLLKREIEWSSKMA